MSTDLSQRISVSIQQAAELTGVSVDTIRRAVAAKQIPVKYPTSRAVMLVEDLRAWIAAAPSDRSER